MSRRTSSANALAALALCFATLSAHASDWLPVSPDELAMRTEPKAPSAPAIYLYRQVDRNDSDSTETCYARIKILTEEGRQYGNVEIPFDKANEGIRDIEARTIRPDGSIAAFDGVTYEKPLLEGRGVKMVAKTFTLPDVQVGSIVEYRYRRNLRMRYAFDSHWILSDSLYTRQAKFYLTPYRYLRLRQLVPIGLPQGTNPPRMVAGRVELEAQDVPAFVTEEHMPPENELKYRVDFIYFDDDALMSKDPAVFWRKYGNRKYSSIESFVSSTRALQQAVGEIVAAGDTPETKLRKIYARAQQIRNITFEPRRSEQEMQRENPQDLTSAQDVWKRGYGDEIQINWLFLGLARAAGFEADPVLVPTRDAYFFNQRFMNPAQLNASVVIVKLEGKELFLDPGTPFTPFGNLPWPETSVAALRLTKNGESWIATPIPPATDSRVERKATLRLEADGTLEGKVTITYSGLEALWRRLEERNEDATDRKKFLEDYLRYSVPVGMDVTLSNTPAWDSSEATLVADFDLRIPGWAAGSRQRAMLPVGLFRGAESHMFQHAFRVHPVYWSFPAQGKDDITIELPPGSQVSSMPKPSDIDRVAFHYSFTAAAGAESVHLERNITVATLLVDNKYYDTVRDFFQMVRAQDAEQLVISSTKTAQQH